jgi:hypothetical protein
MGVVIEVAGEIGFLARGISGRFRPHREANDRLIA